MASDVLNAILDDLDQSMLDNWYSYSEVCVGAWERFSGNNGQMVIVEKHILPTAQKHVENAREDWPKGPGPNDYYDAVYSSFEADVIDRAFSETLEQIMGEIEGYHLDADFSQDEHAVIAGPENAGPHSTHPVWRG